MIQLKDPRCIVDMDSNMRILCNSSQNPHCKDGIAKTKCFKNSTHI